MKQDKIFEATRKATETPLEFTHSVIEQSKKLRTPSPKAAKIGSAIGSSIGGGLLITGAIQLLTGRPLRAFAAVSAGMLTIISNHIYKRRNKQKK